MAGGKEHLTPKNKNMGTESKKQKSNTFGIIAVVIGLISLFTPRIFLSMVLIGLAIFTILGLVKDRTKIYSIIALIIGCFILYLLFSEAKKSVESFDVVYRVECSDCDISYTNASGGTDNVKNVNGRWRQSITAKGDDFLHLYAQNNRNSSSVTAEIYVNGFPAKTETSSGEYAIASASCQPKDFSK